MDSVPPLDVLFRWIHVGSAIVVLGGSVFIRFVLLNALSGMDEETAKDVRARVVKIWKRFVHAGILLFIISGFYNYVMVSIPNHKGDGLYHALLGTKIILAFIVFFLASALVGRSSTFAWIRSNIKIWLLVTISLAALIVAISGFVKVRGIVPSSGGDVESVTTSMTEVSPESDYGRRVLGRGA